MYDHHLISGTPICPSCDKDQDGALGGQRAPKNGDYCICAYCATITRYKVIDNKYSLYIATGRDFEIAQQDGLYAHLCILQEYIKQKIKQRKA